LEEQSRCLGRQTLLQYVEGFLVASAESMPGFDIQRIESQQ